MLTLSPAANGWHLREAGADRFWYAARSEALHAARMIALRLHVEHGIPSAVLLDAGGDAVMVCCHG